MFENMSKRMQSETVYTILIITIMERVLSMFENMSKRMQLLLKIILKNEWLCKVTDLDLEHHDQYFHQK